jgi:deoxyribose-phosphate aldolase
MNHLSKYIDHTLLRPEASKEDIIRACEEAKQFNFAAICIYPYWIRAASKIIGTASVAICSVVGFPHGASKTTTKVREAEIALNDGASEFDMVINIGALKSAYFDIIYNDIRSVVDVVSPNIVKVILETSVLTAKEKITAAKIARDSGAHFVKTSTGFAGGATVEDVKLLYATVGNSMGIKASGGIRDYKTVLEMIRAGASRIGTSKGVKIIKEYNVANASSNK